MALLIAGLAVVTAAVLALALIPVPKSYGFAFGSGEYGSSPVHFEDNSTQSLCPAGAHTWVSLTSRGLNITWTIFAPNGTTIWSQHAANANVTFVLPACGSYYFYATGSGNGEYNIAGTVSYSAPFL